MSDVKEVSLFSYTELENKMFEAIKDVSQGANKEETATKLAQNLLVCPDLMKHLFENVEHITGPQYILDIIEPAIKKWFGFTQAKNYNQGFEILTAQQMFPKIKETDLKAIAVKKVSIDYRKAFNLCKTMTERLERMLPGRMYNKIERIKYNSDDDMDSFLEELYELDQIFNSHKTDYEKKYEHETYLLRKKYGDRLGRVTNK